MHALDWLSKSGRFMHGAMRPIAGVHFYCSCFRSHYQGLCDRAFRVPVRMGQKAVGPVYCEKHVKEPPIVKRRGSPACSWFDLLHIAHSAL